MTTSFIDDTVMPKILTWSLGIQRELYRNGVLEVRYLGTRGLELPIQFRRNEISAFDAGVNAIPTFFQASDVPAAWDANTPTDAAFNAFVASGASNIYAPFSIVPYFFPSHLSFIFLVVGLIFP